MRTSMLYLVCLLIISCSNGAAPRSHNSTGAMRQATETLSPEGLVELHTIVDGSRLAELQWQNFSDYAIWVKEFYATDPVQLAWTSGGKPTKQALELIGILEDAEQKGLESKDYDGERWPGRIGNLGVSHGEADLVNFDVALTVSSMRYISDLHLGRVDPKILHRDFDPERHKYNLAEFLRQRVMTAASVEEALKGIEPPFPGYQRTIGALQKYLQLAKEETPDPLPTVKKPIEPGQNYEALPKLAARLKFLGDLPVAANLTPDSTAYQGDIVEAVKQFQQRHGLESGGKLGPQTIEELNRPMSFRVRQLKLTLERWRWLPHEFEQPPILVNIPEFLLRALDKEGKPTLLIRVVVGRAMRTETPVLEEDMKYVVFWPYWNVPPSILRNELVPKIAKDPAYLEKNAFEVATYSGQVVTDGVVSEETLAQLRAGKLMVRQKPGPKNALGLIKFIFPNDNNVYLHSTPSTSLFAQSRRDFSHGCIRVEDPAALAEWVLRNNPGWTRERIDAAFKAQKEQQVNLTNVIPVLIVYGTAVVPEDGRAKFLEDIYGLDKKLEKLIAEAYAAKT
ncbi:MAG TPA: L,D-transpeptidase family protein [Candidatus Acidoferrum sp.]|nr:L,D-transpeptidase family protein [Candidatus Acidoferrum sp.]